MKIFLLVACSSDVSEEVDTSFTDKYSEFPMLHAEASVPLHLNVEIAQIYNLPLFTPYRKKDVIDSVVELKNQFIEHRA